MTKETLSKANVIVDELDWAEKVLYHIGHNYRLTFDFDTTKSCIESHTRRKCPDWLKDIIAESIRQKVEEWKQEFEKL